MKKTLLSLGVLVASLSANAQVDTLTEFFIGTPTIYGVDPASGGGYLSGNNGYGDLAKMQLFDDAYGVSGGGFITKLLFAAPVKSGTGTFKAVIWANDNGAPGSQLGSVTINLADVDTSAAAFKAAEQSVFYNIAASFANPVAIPASNDFWAGVILPTASGDTIALITNTDGDFPDGATHAGEFWSDGSFYTFGDANNWDLKIALAVFPVVNFTAGIEENTLSATVYPNPAMDVLNIRTEEAIQHVAISSIDGKVVANASASSVDISTLNAGVYVYNVTTVSGKTAKGNFFKK
jgi:hypothetical protein